ncbi:MAG: hypothetical protein COB40_08285 [Marinosulfonomonas sp.]|nr:MAG: hypothetical protein COB40_08285 [Marinosulfonomonas sp.]
MKYLFTSSIVISFMLSAGLAVSNPEHDEEGIADHEAVSIQLIMPKMDAELGRELFGSKGCATCHSVNGVGGEDASALDAHDMEPYMNPFDLAAKMWRMAPFMIEAQEEELGEQIQFTGDELSSIIAFLHDDLEQHEFTLESLSPEMQEMLKAGHGD